eukprot:6189895-Pleurochrysis_carterae.AAC.1
MIWASAAVVLPTLRPLLRDLRAEPQQFSLHHMITKHGQVPRPVRARCGQTRSAGESRSRATAAPNSWRRRRRRRRQQHTANRSSLDESLTSG